MHTVVVGGGFAGVKAALELSKKQIGKVTLISNEPYFLHHATLYATATGRSAAESIIPLNEIFFNHPNVTVVQDTVTSIDPDRKLVVSDKKSYQYDNVIIALGSVTTYFGISGMEQHAYGIKSLDEIRAFHQHIENEVVHEGQLDRNYVIIGAGPTGVELVGALCEYLHHLIDLHQLKHARVKLSLIEAAPRILPRSSATAAKIVEKRLKAIGVDVQTNKKVEALDEENITIAGKKVPTKTAVWTSGVANHPFFKANASYFDLAPNGRANVNKFLEGHKDIYVIGDNNTVQYGGLAWPALRQGAFVAQHLARKASGRPLKAYKPALPPSGIPVGDKWGYVEWFGVYAAGRPGSLIRRLIELVDYCNILPFQKAVAIWRSHDISQVDI
ncbi:MAG: hypothetical protein JWN33_435 [Candidatus Saccharibacteria bacterium]|nr:hypothetical protein [Candidatus Saccharibacteria bacterium]